jgi:hypothetical protein
LNRRNTWRYDKLIGGFWPCTAPAEPMIVLGITTLLTHVVCALSAASTQVSASAASQLAG